MVNHQFSFKKRFGQNFILDDANLNNLVAAISLSACVNVLEIGSGPGYFSYLLAKQANEVLAVEIDQTLYKHAKRNYKRANLTFMRADILKVDWSTIVKKFKNPKLSLILVGNLPYNIASQIIFLLLKQNYFFTSAYFCLQKEFALRLLATSHEHSYGALSVIVQRYYSIKSLIFLPKELFTPTPKIDSIFLGFLNNHHEKYDEKYHQFIKALFVHRRKTLLNNLEKIFSSKEKAWIFLKQCNYHEKTRIADLSALQIKELFVNFSVN